MTIREAKDKVRIKHRIKRIIEYVLAWVLIIGIVLAVYVPVQCVISSYLIEKYQAENKTHVTILIGGEKITLEDVDVVHVEEE